MTSPLAPPEGTVVSLTSDGEVKVEYAVLVPALHDVPGLNQNLLGL